MFFKKDANQVYTTHQELKLPGPGFGRQNLEHLLPLTTAIVFLKTDANQVYTSHQELKPPGPGFGEQNLEHPLPLSLWTFLSPGIIPSAIGSCFP